MRFSFSGGPSIPFSVFICWHFVSLINALESRITVSLRLTGNIFLFTRQSITSQLTKAFRTGSNISPQELITIVDLISQFPDTVTNRILKTNLISYDSDFNNYKIPRSRSYQFLPDPINRTPSEWTWTDPPNARWKDGWWSIRLLTRLICRHIWYPLYSPLFNTELGRNVLSY